MGRAERVVAQARNRLAGVMAESVSRLVSLHDVEARPIRKGRLGKPVEFGYKAQIVEKPARRRAAGPAFQRITARTGRTPPAVTADRGYGQASVERDLHELGVASVAIPRKGKPGAARREFEHGGPSAPRSNGVPDPKAGSATSNEATAGTAPNPPASTEPEPGAGTAYSHTTSSR